MRRTSRWAVAALVAVVGVGAVATLAEAGGDPAPGNGPGIATRMTVSRAAAPAPAAQAAGTVSISPCRIVDTRAGGGAMSAGVARSFFASGTTGFPAQGGKSGGCGIPSAATSINVVFQSTGATGSGYANETPYGVAFATASLLHYAKGQTTGSGASFTLTPGGGLAFSLKTSGNKVDLLVDVVGYTIPAIHAVLISTGGILSGSSRVLDSTHTSTGAYTVTIDRDLTGCTAIAGMDGGAFFASAVISGSFVFAHTYNLSGASQDLYWTLDVIC